MILNFMVVYYHNISQGLIHWISYFNHLLRLILHGFLGVEKTVNNFFSLMLSTLKFLYGIKQFHYPQLLKSSLTCNFSETGLFLRVIITIPFKSFE